VRNIWVSRLGWLVAAVVGFNLALTVLDYEPRLVRVALLTTVCIAVTWVVADVLGDLGPGWRVRLDTPLTEPGHDHRLSAYLRVVEGHLTSSTPDPGLRDRLARLVDRRLARRYGLRRHDPEAEERIGPELLAVLDGPPRRLSAAEIDRHVRRIEEL
jgi:hypothetical protein